MQRTAYNIMLFYICLNLAAGLLASPLFGNLLGGYRVNPAQSPEQLNFWNLASSSVGGLTGILTVTVPSVVGSIISIMAGHALIGVALLVLAGLSMLFPVVATVVAGFPLLLANLGVPQEIVTIMAVLTGFVWLTFFAEFLGGRPSGD